MAPTFSAPFGAFPIESSKVQHKVNFKNSFGMPTSSSDEYEFGSDLKPLWPLSEFQSPGLDSLDGFSLTRIHREATDYVNQYFCFQPLQLRRFIKKILVITLK